MWFSWSYYMWRRVNAFRCQSNRPTGRPKNVNTPTEHDCSAQIDTSSIAIRSKKWSEIDFKANARWSHFIGTFRARKKECEEQARRTNEQRFAGNFRCSDWKSTWKLNLKFDTIAFGHVAIDNKLNRLRIVRVIREWTEFVIARLRQHWIGQQSELWVEKTSKWIDCLGD